MKRTGWNGRAERVDAALRHFTDHKFLVEDLRIIPCPQLACAVCGEIDCTHSDLEFAGLVPTHSRGRG